MNRTEENRLADLAKTARRLRECIDAADSMLRSWAKHKSEARDVYVSMSDRLSPRWNAGMHFPAEVVTDNLIPVLRAIRDRCVAELRALPAEIKR